MRKMERALALLLTLVMLFATCGFAEEAEAVDFAPEAIEASEQPEEELVEAPAEEAVEEPVEEPAEEPAEDAQEFSIESEDFGYIEKPCPAVESGGYHSFQNGKCTACGYKCPHGRVDTTYAWEVVSDHGEEVVNNDMAPVFAPVDGEKHLIKMRYRYVVTLCRDCSKIISKKKLKKETSYTVEAPHDFGDGENYEISDRCYLCGYVKDAKCAHENTTTVEREVIDGYEQIEGDGVKHLVKGTKYPNAKKCLDCGEVFDLGEGEPFTREEPHMKQQFEQGYDYNYDYGYGWWDEGGDGSAETPYDIEIHCVCGYTFDAGSENYEHEHKWEDCTEEWNERCEAIPDDYENHNRIVDVYKGKQCSVCGIHLEMKKVDEKAIPEPHVWDAGFCTVCGMSQMCAHSEEVLDGIYTANELKQKGLLDEGAPDTFTSLGEARHLVSSTLYRLYVCAYCREPLRYEFADSEDVRVDAHDWKNGKCTLCGYTCKHENKYTDFYGEATYSQKTDKKGNVDKKVHIAMPQKEDYIQQSCSNCGKIFINYKKTKKGFEEPHTFVAEGDKIVCKYCKYELNCDHAKARFIAETRYGTRIVNLGDEDAHEVVGAYSVHKVCPDCGYEFEAEASEYSDGPAPHLFDEGSTICQLCGYAKEGTAAISLSVQKTKQLAVGETWAPALNIAPKTATGVTYKTSNGKIFDVDPATGKIVAVSAGAANITAIAIDGKLTAKCAVKVTEAPKTVSLSNLPKQMGKGEKLYAGAELLDANGEQTGGDVRYASSNTKVLKIGEDDGKVTAVGIGAAKIYAFAYNGVQCSAEVEVKKAPKGIILTPSATSKKMSVGDTCIVKAEIAADAAGQINWSSNKEAVAKVEPTENPGEFKITAVATGKAKITFSTYNKKKIITVTVK